MDPKYFSLYRHLIRQREASYVNFGPPRGTPPSAGVIDHLKKELVEVAADPDDRYEWIDIILLGFDGLFRQGYTPQEIIEALIAKQDKNEKRVWPDWRTYDPAKSMQHVRMEAGVDDDARGNDWRADLREGVVDPQRTAQEIARDFDEPPSADEPTSASAQVVSNHENWLRSAGDPAGERRPRWGAALD